MKTKAICTFLLVLGIGLLALGLPMAADAIRGRSIESWIWLIFALPLTIGGGFLAYGAARQLFV